MNQDELISAIYRKGRHDKKQVKAILDTLCRVMEEALSGGEHVTLPGIGRLSTVQRRATTCSNQSNGIPIKTAAKRLARFTPLPVLISRLNP